MPKFACCLLYNIHAVRLAVFSNVKIYGVGKNSPTLLRRLWTKVHQIRGHVGDPCRLTSFFLIVYIMFHCRDMFCQSSKSVPKSIFAPSPYRLMINDEYYCFPFSIDSILGEIWVFCPSFL